jgi:hypothetical protein
MTDGSDAAGIDVTGLPDDVVARIDALQPGEEIAIVRGGARVATITGAGSVLTGVVISPDRAAEEVPGPASRPDRAAEDVPDRVTVVAAAMKLSESARAALSAELGDGYIVVDLQAATATTDVLLLPPASPQLIGNLRAMFPAARIVIAEVADESLGVDYQGVIRRALDAGAEAYLTSTSIPRLARQLDRAIIPRPQLAAGSAEPPEIGAAAYDRNSRLDIDSTEFDMPSIEGS